MRSLSFAFLLLMAPLSAAVSDVRVLKNDRPYDFRPLLGQQPPAVPPGTPMTPGLITAWAGTVTHGGAVIEQIPPALPAIPQEKLGRVAPQASNPACTPIDSCGIAITDPGCYAINRDLVSQNVCLNLHDLQNVTLRCSDHQKIVGQSGGALYVTNVDRLTIDGCSILAPDAYARGLTFGGAALLIDHARHLNIRDATIQGIHADFVEDALWKKNHFQGQCDFQSSSDLTFDDNDFTSNPGLDTIFNLRSMRGSHNRFIRNRFDGKWDGAPQQAQNHGTDDGLILRGETDSIVKDNHFKNYYDAGIETLEMMDHVRIIGNHIRNTWRAGIGAYWDTSWRHVEVRDNVVMESSQFLRLYYGGHFDPTPVTTTLLYFQDNVIEGNTFRKPTVADKPIEDTPSMIFDATHPPTIPKIAGNNRLRNNNLGTQNPGPCLNPPNAIVDKGGNVWGDLPSPSSPICHFNTQ